MPEIYFLELSNNPLENLSALKHRNLDRLVIDNIGLKDLNDIPNLNEIYNISAKSNNIRNINISKELSKLIQIDLSNNNIDQINTFDVFTKLSTLNLTNNKLKEIPDLNSMTNIESLILDHNSLSKLPNVNELEDLDYFSISYNNISNLNNFKGFYDKNIIDFFNLSHNKINNIDNIDSLKLNSINVLFLNNNQITNAKPLELLNNNYKIKINDNPIEIMPNLDDSIFLPIDDSWENTISRIAHCCHFTDFVQYETTE